MTTLRPAPLVLADRHGRIATDLRVSLTDRCNLRCTYCMPADGLPWLPRHELLDDAEISRLIRIAVEMLGVREVRFTGGEPLLRPGLEQIIAAANGLDPQPELSLTTNGIGLAHRAAALAGSGLTRLNVSLDTLRSDRFRQLTRRDRLADVLAGLEAAARVGLQPIKVNSVLMRGVNDDESPQLLRFCLDHGFHLRFIEQMPLDADHAWRRDNMITAAEILDRLGTRFQLTPVPEPRGSAPAERWLVDGGPATVGVIGSSPGRSAPRASGPALPPTARSETACSAPPRPTCATFCARGRTTRWWPSRGSGRCGPRPLGTAWTLRASPRPAGR